MHDYIFLNGNGLAEIQRQKLLDLEVEHARLSLELRLANATGIKNEQVTQAERQLELLVQQMAILISWIVPAPEESPAIPVAANGQGSD